MNTIMRLALVATVAIFAQNVNAQDDNNQSKQEVDKQEQIAYLKEQRVQVETDWKNTLKYRVERIIKDSKDLGRSEQEIETLKKAAAQEVALNIQNQQAIIDNQIALVERTGYADPSLGSSVEIGFGGKDSKGNRVLGVAYNSNKSGTKRYDARTYGENVFAFGLNNVISDNAEIGDDFSIGRSRFFEYGYALKTRVFKNSGAFHFKYGLSIQINKLVARNNETLVIGDDGVSFQEFPFELRKSQLRATNLVIPLHLEFGGWKKEQEEDYVRYRTAGKFRMGVGVYAGVSLGEQQKLKYREDGNRVKIKNRRDFGGDNLVFGLSSYVRLYDDLSLYAKYDLSSLVEIESLGEVNNLSLGVRFDF